jgi:hypothetical protein
MFVRPESILTQPAVSSVFVVSSDFTDRYDDMARLMKLTWDVDTNIEPHPIRTDEFNARNNHFVEEIVRTGIKVA